MKIGLIVPGFSADESDWCIPALLNMVRMLAKSHEVHVFTLRYPHRKATYTVYGATVHAFGGATTAGFGRLWLISQAVRCIVAESRRGKFDVLHGLWADEPGFIAMTTGKLLRVPVVVSLMGGELIHMPEIGYGHQLSRSARWMISQALKHADVVTVGSQTLKARAAHMVNAQVVPLGVDTTLFFPAEADCLTGQYKLLHVASLSPIKNQVFLLETFAKITLPDVHLHIVGDGVLQAELLRLAESLNVSERVHFHREISHERLPDYYRSADLCLLTSHYESQSMVALEAAACQRVTIGTNVGLLAEMIGGEWLSDNAEQLADFITLLLQDDDLRHTLNNHLYQQVQARYSIEHSVQSWLKHYKNL